MPNFGVIVYLTIAFMVPLLVITWAIGLRVSVVFG